MFCNFLSILSATAWAHATSSSLEPEDPLVFFPPLQDSTARQDLQKEPRAEETATKRSQEPPAEKTAAAPKEFQEQSTQGVAAAPKELQEQLQAAAKALCGDGLRGWARAEGVRG